MSRDQKWMSFIALGLILTWQGTLAQAQQLQAPHEASPNQPTPAAGRVALRSDYEPDSQGSGDSDETAESETIIESQEPSDSAETTDSEVMNADEPSSDELQTDSSDSGTTEEPADGGDEAGDGSVETIKERYPDGSVKIEREVTQDQEGNYINHGAWKMWDQKGNPLAQGEFRQGNRTGTWIRWYRNPSEAPLLTREPYRQFKTPFISQGTFEHGQLDGVWTIYDGQKRKISQWEFADGKRHGASTWWYVNGKKLREIQYRDGRIDGQVIEWNPEGAVSINDTYQEGRRLGQKEAKYPQGAKKSQGMYLFAEDVEQTPDDWWNCKVMTTQKAGKDQKHGAWTSWHPSGQKQLEGTYDHDLQVGLFTWWHANGQRALEGRFENGKQDGNWTWWYPNGQKSIHGQYVHGNPTGRWTWWKEDGRVAQSADLSHSEGVVIDSKPGEPNRMPQARKPTGPVR